MKILIIGSTQYQDRFKVHRDCLTKYGHDVKIPAFDYHPEFDSYDVCAYNRGLIEWADEIHIIWDRRSTGTIFDLGMAFMANKPIRIIYLESKTFEKMMKEHERRSHAVYHKGQKKEDR